MRTSRDPDPHRLVLLLLVWFLPAVLAATGCTPAPDDSGESVASGSDTVLPFIADDYPRALAEAKERGLPLFIESWAPW